MDNLFYNIQTGLLAIGRGTATGVQGVILSIIVSTCVFFAVAIIHSFSGGRVFFSDIIGIAAFAFLYFGGFAALIMGAGGFVYGIINTISERKI